MNARERQVQVIADFTKNMLTTMERTSDASAHFVEEEASIICKINMRDGAERELTICMEAWTDFKV